ncbi:MAG: LCP family protein [Hespellia sp.]|nr:LCP family protein [Hespellia sp.]
MNNSGNRKSKTMTLILVILIFVIAIGGALFFALYQKPAETVSDSGVTEDEEESDTIIYNGKEYELNKDIRTVLFLGVDTREKIENANGAGNNGQADCIILMLMNKKTKKTTLLEISRESMVDVDIYAQDGEYFATEQAQIALQYAYGDGDNKSSWLMKKAVSNLLGGIRINSCIALNIDGIVNITDALGGVELTVPKDYTYIEPEFAEGATITLNGQQAERYVRYRDITVSGSNTDRMERQNQFIPAMVAKAKSVSNGDSTAYSRLMDAASSYMTTDLSGDDLKGLASYDVIEDVEIVPGEVKAGAEHDEYWVDSEKTHDLVMKLFYKEK